MLSMESSIRVCVAGAVAITLSWPARAAAQTVAAPGSSAPRSVMFDPEPEYETRSYGWQTAVVDGAAVLFFVAAVHTAFSDVDYYCTQNCRSDGDGDGAAVLGMTGVALYGAGGPTIHAAHGRWGTAAASLGIRALPIVLGVPLMQGNDDSDAGAGILLGGMLAAMIVDATVLARERVPVKPQAAAGLHVAPGYDRRSRTGFVSVGGSF
jgi:hypothetical protein